MSRLPSFMKDSLHSVAATTRKPEELIGSIAGLLDAERKLEALSRSVEAFREASHGLGILDEARSGENIYDSWAKLSRFFLAPLLGGSTVLSGKAVDYEEVPAGYEAVGARWERMISEVEAFVSEEKALDRLFADSPVSAHIGFRFRSRLLLLDRRAERIKVALDLIRRDLTQAARSGLEQLTALMAPKARPGGRGGQKQEGTGAAVSP